MKQSKKQFISICFLILLFSFSCSQKGAHIKIKNSSGNALADIIISGNGFSKTIPKLEKNESTIIQVFPKGESSLTI